MSILTKWGFRTVRANLSRTVTAILAVVGFFALLTSSSYIVSAFLRDASLSGTNLTVNLIGVGDYLFLAIVDYLFFGLLAVTAAIQYSIFSVTADESLRDYRILTSAGATARQIRRSLELRALALSGGGGIAGTALGLLGARFSLDERQFFAELPHYFLEARTIEMLAVGLLLTPCLMAIATAAAFRRRRREKRPRAPKRSIFRRSFARRVFGVGGVLGQMNCKKNRRYRVIFTAAFALCLAAPAVLSGILQMFADARMQQENYDMSLDCWDLETENPLRGSEILDELLRNTERFGIESCTTVTDRGCDDFYTLLDDDWMNETDPLGSPVVRDGKPMRLCKNSFGFIFLDDTTFDRLVRENGFEPQPDGAILYNVAYENKRTHPFKTVDPSRDVTLYFLPESFLYYSDEEFEETQTYIKPIANASDEDFLRAAEPEAKTQTIHILGLTQELPFDLEDDRPTILLPERMYPSLAEPFSALRAQSYDGSEKVPTIKLYLLKLNDPEAGLSAFKEAVNADPRLLVKEFTAGMGNKYVTAQDVLSDASYAPLVRGVTIRNLYADRKRMESLHALISGIRTVLPAMYAWILFVGVLNTAHMNRVTRRREKAILDSVGMDRRQLTGMLLYESTRYALCSAALGFLAFLGLFRLAWQYVPNLLINADLQRESWRVQTHFYNYAKLLTRFPSDLGEICARTGWIFAGGAALIFVLLIVTDKIIERRSGRDELIRILKDDSDSV